MKIPLLPALLGVSLLLSACATAPHAAGTGSTVAVMEIRFPKEKKNRRVVIELDDKSAPATASNFRDLVSRRYYNGMRFHRAFPDKLVQTGDPKRRHGEVGRSGTGGPGYTVPPEIRLKLTKGSVATARLPDEINPARLSNGSQFFVCIDALPQLNGKYTVFGRVIEGLDVLQAVSNSPTDSNDFPTEKIIIKTIRME